MCAFPAFACDVGAGSALGRRDVILVRPDPPLPARQPRGLPIEGFYDALKAEGCLELDRPGSTSPLNLHPLFQVPTPLLPHCVELPPYAAGQFPKAEAFQRHTLKLPVWHREEDIPLVDAYAAAFAKVTTHHHDLTGWHA